MNAHIYKIIKILLIFSIDLIFISFTKAQTTKLLIYATIEDSIILYKTDTNWLRKNVCIKIKIDTIDTRYFKYRTDKWDKKNIYFKYQKKYYNKNQLFELYNYSSLLKIRTIFISLWSGTSDTYEAKDSCLSYKQKDYILWKWRNYKRYNAENKISDYLIVHVSPIGCDGGNLHIILNDILIYFK